MPNYILRDVPPDLWDVFRDRANRAGWPMRPLLLALMNDYASGRIEPSLPPPPRTDRPTDKN